ncbi:hypothetical protein [Methylobacterium thuringiense]|uniref:Uncharacterized protein n=1 Tax=Methylobacterium thuringiense TaxID=1003091 RepID=A0ABQ4THA1_9HYPH|nr:hypothetical protein [Methylobacterium thuringiense]GJE54598.1 hypothetical protein EKPJFOCH_1076 [Methylobacterium thuringiense]
MAAKTFARRVSGIWREILGVVISTGAANAGDIPALDDTGHLDPSVMPVSYGADVKVLPATEALSASNLVNVWSSSGTASVRKADATAEGKPCHGFVLDSVASGTSVTVYFGRKITGLTGIVPGQRYYLDTTAGGFTATPISGAGKVDQFVGEGISTTEIGFEPDDYVVKAA